MSDKKNEGELDNVSGGVETHPFPIKGGPRPLPPTHPAGPIDPPYQPKTNPVG